MMILIHKHILCGGVAQLPAINVFHTPLFLDYCTDLHQFCCSSYCIYPWGYPKSMEDPSFKSSFLSLYIVYMYLLLALYR